VLDPKGIIGAKQRDLLLIATYLMLIVVIPVFILTFAFAWRYREGNDKAKYTPDWGDSVLAESIWWGLPCIIVAILSVLTWKGCFELDPFKAIDPSKKPLVVQVIALQYKWLFIYPEQKIATINHLQIPQQTPIRFEITADAPMNAFWIPALGGQIAAMPGMRTELHLMADEPGVFEGLSANISGTGFARMHFKTTASSQEEFDHWVVEMQKSPKHLTVQLYKELRTPGEHRMVESYVLDALDLYDQTIMKYMSPMAGMHNMVMPAEDESMKERG
jgi:cytochrome o ubiquinol oxidase subunit 2